jgi:hypothetical protein
MNWNCNDIEVVKSGEACIGTFGSYKQHYISKYIENVPCPCENKKTKCKKTYDPKCLKSKVYCTSESLKIEYKNKCKCYDRCRCKYECECKTICKCEEDNCIEKRLNNYVHRCDCNNGLTEKIKCGSHNCNINITDVAAIGDNTVIVSTRKGSTPLVQYTYDSCYNLVSKDCIGGLNRCNVQFVSNYKGVPVFGYEKCFDIHYVVGGQVKAATIMGSSSSLKCKVMETIFKNASCCLCTCPECYYLMDVLKDRDGLLLFVQLLCSHKNNQRIIFAIDAPMLCTSDLTFKQSFRLSGIYNLYTLGKKYKIPRKQNVKLVVSGTSRQGNTIYIMTNYGKGGYLWKTQKFGELDMMGCSLEVLRKCSKPLELLCYPRGITHVNDNTLMVVHGNAGYNSFKYTILKIWN